MLCDSRSDVDIFVQLAGIDYDKYAVLSEEIRLGALARRVAIPSTTRCVCSRSVASDTAGVGVSDDGGIIDAAVAGSNADVEVAAENEADITCVDMALPDTNSSNSDEVNTSTNSIGDGGSIGFTDESFGNYGDDNENKNEVEDAGNGDDEYERVSGELRKRLIAFRDREKLLLKDHVVSALDDIALTVELTGKDHRVVHAAIKGEDEAVIHTDICARVDGAYKAAFLRRVYRASSCHLPLFGCLVSWARSNGVIRPGNCIDDNNNNDQNYYGQPRPKFQLMESGRFHALILLILDRISPDDDCRFLEKVVAAKPMNIAEALSDLDTTIIAEGEGCNGTELGEKLLQFFEFGSKLFQDSCRRPRQTCIVSDPCEESSADVDVDVDVDVDDYVDVEENDVVLQFVWPVPGSPVHEWTAQEIRKFSSFCLRALHCWLYSRCWQALLQQAAMDENAYVTFVQRLPPSLSDALRGSTPFHVAVLQAASNAVVTMEYDGSVLVVKGQGTRYQVKLLKEEVLKLMRNRRWCSVGYIQTNNSAYFMEGSVYLYARDCPSKDDAIVALRPYTRRDAFQRHHSIAERSLPIRQLPPCKSVDWRREFKATLISKIFSQLHGLPLEELDTLRLSVHMGTFYTMHASTSLGEGMASCVTIANLETYLSNGRRNRKVFERPDYDPMSLPEGYDILAGSSDSDSGSDSESASKSSDNNGDSDDKVGGVADTENGAVTNWKEEEDVAGGIEGVRDAKVDSEDGGKKINKEKKGTSADENANKVPSPRSLKSLSAGYWPCEAFDWFSDPEGLKTMDAAVKRLFGGTLGYELYKPKSVDEIDPDLKSILDVQWFVEVICSGSYATHVFLDEKLAINSVSERALSWLHGTLVDADPARAAPAPAPVVGKRGKEGEENSRAGGGTVGLSGTSTADSASGSGARKKLKRRGAAAVGASASADDTAFAKTLPVNYSGAPPKTNIPPTFPTSRYHDLRFKLQTQRPVAESDKLYKYSCPEGKAPITVRKVASDGSTVTATASATVTSTATATAISRGVVVAAPDAPTNFGISGIISGMSGTAILELPVPFEGLKESHRVTFARHAMSRTVMVYHCKVNTNMSTNTNIKKGAEDKKSAQEVGMEVLTVIEAKAEVAAEAEADAEVEVETVAMIVEIGAANIELAADISDSIANDKREHNGKSLDSCSTTGVAAAITTDRATVLASSSDSNAPARVDGTGQIVDENGDIDMTVISVFTRAVHYEGQRLEERLPVVDLSLEIKLAPLIAHMKGELSRDRCERWLEAVLDHVVEVSDCIRENKY
jgi:hypothetical protein